MVRSGLAMALAGFLVVAVVASRVLPLLFQPWRVVQGAGNTKTN